MVTHIVIFRWIEGVTEQQVAAFAQAMDAMAEQLGDLVTIRHGRDLGLRDGNGDYALVGSFADQESWATYQAHPLHQAFVRDFVTPMQASRLSIQF